MQVVPTGQYSDANLWKWTTVVVWPWDGKRRSLGIDFRMDLNQGVVHRLGGG
jgi:hypothetical protein